MSRYGRFGIGMILVEIIWEGKFLVGRTMEWKVRKLNAWKGMIWVGMIWMGKFWEGKFWVGRIWERNIWNRMFQ